MIKDILVHYQLVMACADRIPVLQLLRQLLSQPASMRVGNLFLAFVFVLYFSLVARLIFPLSHLNVPLLVGGKAKGDRGMAELKRDILQYPLLWNFRHLTRFIVASGVCKM